MSFTRIRTINGQQYLYREERYREGGKVRSRSISLGPVSAKRRRLESVSVLPPPPPLPRNLERYVAQHAEQVAREKAAQQNALDELHTKYGLVVGSLNPTPIEKPAPVMDLAAPGAAPQAPAAEQEAAPPGDGADAQ